MTNPDLEQLLEDLKDHVKTEMVTNPTIVEAGDDFSIDDLYVEARKWHRLDRVVAVVADLKGSTTLSYGKYLSSTAAIYEATTGGLVRAMAAFEPNYIAIQGDGAVALFWGERSVERAMCAAITVKTFSERHLVPQLKAKWSALPETGLKVGVAMSRVAVKKVGIPRSDHQEPVWAGKAVNYAAKCAQQANVDQLIVTGSVWDYVEANDYLSASCDCGTPLALWSDVDIDKIHADDGERTGSMLTSSWCKIHGAEFCAAILDGQTSRPRAAATREKILKAQRLAPLREAQRVKRINKVNQMRGLAMRRG